MTNIDPELAVEALDGTVPIALLPVRIETRYAEENKALHIRVFPDQVHLDSHEPGLTDDERAAGEWYWNERWPAPNDADRAETAWKTLTGRITAGRARYLVDTLRPTNLTEAPGGTPTFSATPHRDSAWTRAVEATCLPERWVAVGYQNRVEVFRVWSSPVADRLAAGPTPNPAEAPPDDAPDAPVSRLPKVQNSFKWAVDPDAARENGMLLTVRDTDLAFGALANGLSRLVVIGVDWTLTPEQAVASLEALLGGHAASGDLAFVEPGTPTNNTAGVRSGFTTAPAARIAEWAPPVTGIDPDVAVTANAGRLAAALGIDAAPLAVAPGAGGRHHQIASALLDATWEATGGYYATDMLEPLGNDANTDAIRVHAVESLYAAGPLPHIRIGPQPYGVLPVASRRLSPVLTDATSLNLHRATGMMRGLWDQHIDELPRLGRVGDTTDVDDVMLDLLQRTPVPWQLQWREMVPPPQWSSTEWLTQLRTQQAPMMSDTAGQLDIPPNKPTRVQYLTAVDESHPLDVPLVVKGGAGTSYIGEIAALARRGAEGRRDLNLRQGSATLLEALLTFAATQELDKAATAEVAATAVSPEVRLALPDRLGVRTPDLVRVEAPDPNRPALSFDSARELAATTVPDPARPDELIPVHDAVASRLSSAPLDELIRDTTSTVNGLARFLVALDNLTSAPGDELEWAFRGVLDLYSSRLDAWFTSLATARLATHRALRPTGVHLGCYGWVDDLRPDQGAAAESLGYIAAPSLGHAVAAAVLRSGRQSHMAEDAFDLDLRSARVREALKLLEGVSAGQPLAALLGYRIERKLHDVGLGELVVPLRIAAPLRARSGDLAEPVESVAARDVVDGVQLLAMVATEAWLALLATHGVTGDRQTRLETVLAEVADIYDAVTDVLFAETVHQAAAGNLDRAAAAAGTLDRQERPTEPDVVRTPREGTVVANRVVVAFDADASATAPPGWPARGVRGTLEPRLDAWLGSVLGDPSLLQWSGRLHRGETVTDLGSVTAVDLGLSPLALVLAAGRPAVDRPTELEARAVAVLASRVTDPDESDSIELDSDDLLPSVALHGYRLVSGSRALGVSDLTPVGTDAPSGSAGTIDIDELTARVDSAVDATRAALASVSAAPPTSEALRAALEAVTELVGVDALPLVRHGLSDEAVLLREQADDVIALLTETLARVDELAGAPLGPADSAASRLAEIAAAALGPHQPLLPRFRLSDGAALSASVADRAALTNGDETAPVTWLHRASLVRPALDALCSLLTHAEADGTDVVAGLTVAQLPHRLGAPWCALPFGDHGPPAAGTIGVVAVAPDGLDPSRPLAGLSVDAWSEVIPSSEHTAGLTFHYDAPGTRPPQAILLAVHPDLEPGPWSLFYLLETVVETIALAQLRALTLREVDELAGFLPALFLPTNYTRDVPSVSLKGVFDAARAANLATAPGGVRGKP